jgi:hypothetical protein
MKTTLKYLFLLLGAGFTAAAFAGLVGIASPAVFSSGAVALSIFSVIGMLLISAGDHGRRPIVTASTPPFTAQPVTLVPAVRRSRAYGIRRRDRIAA